MSSSTYNGLDTRQLTEVAVLIALAAALELIATFIIPRQPQGGSISISMIPIVVIVYRQGFKIGAFAGLVFGLLNWMIAGLVIYSAAGDVPFYVPAAEVTLDYLLAYGVSALAVIAFKTINRDIIAFTVGMVIAGALRYLMHFISGVFIFGGFAPEDQSVWVYSLTYNGAYMLPTIVLMGVLAPLIFPKLSDLLN